MKGLLKGAVTDSPFLVLLPVSLLVPFLVLLPVSLSVTDVVEQAKKEEMHRKKSK